MVLRKSSDSNVIVDTEYYWQPIATCPLSAKVQLLSKYGVAVYGEYHNDSESDFWTHWAPLPKKPKD
jgi:hypothetical protein